ncbi:MAG: ComF family protein [Clostridiales bacterium]|nr:ComF family protein [Clostridiales bacterium]
MKFLKDLQKIFYPRNLTCSVCSRENFNGKTVCDGCEAVLPKNDGNICDHCGRRTPFPVAYCDFCKGKSLHIDCMRSVFEYGEPISGMIRRLKYYGEKHLAEEFAQRMVRVYHRSLPTVDAVVCIPSSKARIKMKGYNQSLLLAKEVAERLELPLINALEKTKDTGSQVGLKREERRANLKGSFKVVERAKVKGKRILIVDDVVTTGTTLEIVAEKLKNEGASEVYGIAVASVTMSKIKTEQREPLDKIVDNDGKIERI